MFKPPNGYSGCRQAEVYILLMCIQISMQGTWLLVGLFSVLVTNAAAQSCPATLNSEAQIVFYNDRVLSPEIRQPIYRCGHQFDILQGNFRILMMLKFNKRLKMHFSSSMKGLAWTSLSWSPMS